MEVSMSKVNMWSSTHTFPSTPTQPHTTLPHNHTSLTLLAKLLDALYGVNMPPIHVVVLLLLPPELYSQNRHYGVLWNSVQKEYYETKRTSVEMLSVGQKKLEQIE
ncbi:hypothetical protein JHK82_035032 [Glycine max]|nr:hypothetical protein JHK82_035032 [Glycine max]